LSGAVLSLKLKQGTKIQGLLDDFEARFKFLINYKNNCLSQCYPSFFKDQEEVP
jgi:hypothetical protein